MVAHCAPLGDLPYLLVFRDYQAGLDASAQALSTTGWDKDLFRFRIGYKRDANITEEERDALRRAGWWFDSLDPNLRPVAGIIEDQRMRVPSDAELETFTVAAYATIAMLDERLDISFAEYQANVSLVLKLDEQRVANVRLSWDVKRALAGVDLGKLAARLMREPK
jgi:hypothetical protein